MSASNDSPPKGVTPPASGGPGKKPSALLDLQATEVKDDGGKTAQPAPGTPGQVAGGAATAAAASGSAGTVGGATAPAAAGSAASGSTASSTTTGSGPAAARPAGASVPPVGGATSAASAKASETKSSGAAPGDAKAAAGAKSPTSGSAGKGSGGGDPPPAKAARGPGVGGIVAFTVAGLVGGLFALLAADTVGPQLGLPGTGQASTTEALQRRVSELEARLASAATRSGEPSAAVAASLGAAEKRIAELEKSASRIVAMEAENTRLAEETKTLRETVIAQRPADDPRLTRLQEQLAALSAAAGTDPERGRIPQLAAISGKVADLEATIATQLGQVRKTLGQEIDQRLAPVAEASEAARAGTQRIDREVAAIKSETARLQQGLDSGQAIDARLEQALRAVEQQTAALKVAIDGVRSDLAAQMSAVARPADVTSAVAPVMQKVGQLEANLKDVVRSEDDRRASAERIVLSLELGNLKRAVDRGGAFARELEDVKKLSAGKLDLAPLAKFETSGVATPTELAAEFRGVANAILDAEAVTADASVVDRLLAGAKSIVRVRKVDHDPADKSPEAVVGRMQLALNDGELGKVMEEAASLGDRAKAAARSWLDKVAARHAVETAIARVEDQLKATIAGQPAPAKGVN